VGAGGDMAGLLAVAAPVWARLRVQAWCTRVLVPLRHVLGRGGIGRILVVCRVSRAGTCDGWIYRQSAVRLGLLRLGILMAAPIWQRHGRTCWCLRHPSAAPIGVASGVVGALHVWESGRPRSGRVHAVFRGGSGRVGVTGRPRLLLRRVLSSSRRRIYRFRLRLRVADDTRMGRRQT
jgi:hypothetical protein